MKHPVTATAHRIIEAFWCCTCVPEWGAGVSRIVLYGSMWHMLLKLLLYFRLQVRNFAPPPPLPLNLFQKSEEKCSKIVPALPSHIPKWLKGDPPGFLCPEFQGFSSQSCWDR